VGSRIAHHPLEALMPTADPTPEQRALCAEALAALDARKDEPVEAWAGRLAKSAMEQEADQLEAAREALAQHDAPRCGEHVVPGPGPNDWYCDLPAGHAGGHAPDRPAVLVEHLRVAIGALDAALNAHRVPRSLVASFRVGLGIDWHCEQTDGKLGAALRIDKSYGRCGVYQGADGLLVVLPPDGRPAGILPTLPEKP
jgi:hypothetical protein